jgi:predicted glycoside hydrolase/deacetylase ChbG (UPF0249 family)
MVNGLAAEAALSAAKAHPGLGVGLHLNIVRGRPLSSPEEIPTLVDGQGRFFNSALTLLLRSLSGRISADDAYREYRLQVLYMLERGCVPTHFDGEKHSHLLLPQAVEAIRRLQDEFGLFGVRIVRELELQKALRALGIRTRGSVKQRIKLWLLEYRGRTAKQQLLNLKSPALSYGVLGSGSLGGEHALRVLEAILELKSHKSVEWMFHLGYTFDMKQPEFQAEFGGFYLDDSREKELEFLLSAPVLQLVSQNKHKLISYKDL